MSLLSRTLCKLTILAAAVPGLIWCQVTRLSFRPLISAYSTQLDRLIMITSGPNQLHIYNASSNSDQIVALPGVPLSLSLSSDGTHAAVGFVDAVDYVDLNAGTVAANFPVAAGSGSEVVLGNGYIYIFAATNSQTISIDIGSGAATSISDYYSSSGAIYDPAVNAVYSGTDNSWIERFDTSAGPLTSNSSKLIFTTSSCGRLWSSPDNVRIYNACGKVATVSTDASNDLPYLSTIPGNSLIRYLAESATAGRIAVVPPASVSNVPQTSTPDDTSVFFFESKYLNLVGHFGLSAFQVSGNAYPAHSRGVFFSKDGSSLYVLVEADATSGLGNDYAIQTIALGTQVACAVSLSNSIATTDTFGSLGSIGISAGTNCTYTAVSNVPWIQAISGYYGSGNNKLMFEVRANPTSATRTGTVSINDQTLTVTQTGSAGAQNFSPLSFEVAAADYSKSLDRLILASGTSNEVHVFDPVSGSDQVATLSAPAISLSVAPDGHSAAIGHKGWISIVDLQLLTVTKIIPVQLDANALVLAGNGYGYVFGSDSSYLSADSLSVKIDTAAITPAAQLFSNLSPRLSSDGQSLYAGWFLARIDISTGLLQNGDSSNSFQATTCGNLWLTEDGTRLLTACGTAFRTTKASDDLSPNGSLTGNSGIVWAANSATQHETVVITSRLPGFDSDDTKLQFYDDTALQFLNQTTLPRFPVGPTSYIGHGKYVFWNAAASKIYVVEQADSAAGMLSDFAVSTINPLNLPQDCSFHLDQSSWFYGPAANSMTINVYGENGCSWTALTNNPFLSITSGASGRGAGMVTIAVAANPLSLTRLGTATIAGASISVEQSGIFSCISSFVPTSFNMPLAGGSASIPIEANASCYWASSTNASWISLSAQSSGYGNGSVSITVAPNSGTMSRSGTLIVSGTLVTVFQSGTSAGQTGGLQFVPLTPCRVGDTRTYNDPIGSQHNQTFYLADICGLPVNAAAYSLNVTAVPHGRLQYITVWPAGEPQPVISTLNSYDGRVRANAAIVTAGQNGAIEVFASDTTDVVLDVNGYFVNDATQLVFFPLTPCRITDTRGATGSFGAPFMAAGQSRTFPVRSSACNVPAEAQAYSLNATVAPKGKLGWITTWPTGQNKPLASTLNAPTGAVTANAAIVPAGTNGSIDVFTTDDTELILDIDGYFAPATTGGLSLYPTTPCRVLDTRSPGAGQKFTGLLNVNVQGSSCAVPAGAEAYVLNATVVPTSVFGYLSLWPSGTAQPTVSTLNALDGQVTSNMAITPTTTGFISAFCSHETHLILDLSSYFAP